MVLQFLTELYQDGLSYSALNTARSALAAIVQTTDNKSVGANPNVVRFMKGVFELRTALPRCRQTWDVEVLLNFFRQQKDNDGLSLKDLTGKLCALLLLASAQRVQTIHLMKLSAIKFHDKGCTIYVAGKLKHNQPGHHQSPLEFFRYVDDRKLCVVTCLNDYI